MKAKISKRTVDTLSPGETIFDIEVRMVRPKIGAKSVYELRRRDIVKLLDAIVQLPRSESAASSFGPR